ncbi:GATase1 CTP synthase [Ordospora colligata]|uniref:CTP synthase n=1 Tax=Ordospora colligata OC4 TaxID=1354746 RepID=A0A0B2UHM5_9MICR|nr:GATase1 CTP synthase [Ordospora colligata OC4]KHN68813.1 GATase1 CTP synthase [Ordospora colligata OC4]TBU14036.1 GATase1 CTP synthase [Ordospora colligata]TBU17705.1 GATase1 CTP synthase [Ordospora colligata]
MKYVFISGGVISGVGKGAVSSGVGVILRARGYNVTHMKIDLHMNCNLDSKEICEHGEIRIFEDAHECDMDFGIFIRFGAVGLKRESGMWSDGMPNDLTSRRDPRMERIPYLDPSVINGAVRRIIKTGQKEMDDLLGGKKNAEVVVVELGGSIAESDSHVYLEIFSKLQMNVGKENCMIVGVERIIEFGIDHYDLEKIAMGAMRLEDHGLKYDVLVCRGSKEIDGDFIKRIEEHCMIASGNVYNLPDMESVYHLPGYFEMSGLGEKIACVLGIENRGVRAEMMNAIEKIGRAKVNTVKIGLVARGVCVFDNYASVVHALHFSAGLLGVRAEVVWIDAEGIEKGIEYEDISGCDGIVIPGGFGPRGVEGKIKAIEYARMNKIPLLGICLGYQLAVIEMCRNILGIMNANSEEFVGKGGDLVIRLIEDENGKRDGMLRIGGYEIAIMEGRIKHLYQRSSVRERHRHRYEVCKEAAGRLEREGIRFVGKSLNGMNMKAFEMEDHPFFIGVQYHPELNARPDAPHPLFTELISTCYEMQKGR